MKTKLFFSALTIALFAMSCQPKVNNEKCCDKADTTACSSIDSTILKHHIHTAPISADSALAELKAGNNRYVNDKLESYKLLSAERRATAQKQNPIAIIVSCSDSRVPCEELFDLGVGEIFIIRTAGQVIDKSALGSIEYAAEHLGVKLLVVLGHERCGAVTAAASEHHFEGNIGYLVDQIKPAVEKAKGMQGDLVVNAINENSKLIANQISNCEPILKELVSKGEFKVVTALYDLDEGTVTF